MHHHQSNPESLRQDSGAYSTIVAAFSFLAGVSIFFMFQLNQAMEIVIVGFFFVCAAVVVNAIVLLHLLWILAFEKQDRESTLIRILIVLSNIPITYYLISNL